MINKILMQLWKTVSLTKGGADADEFRQMLIFKFKDSCIHFEVIIFSIIGITSLFSGFWLQDILNTINRCIILF